MAKPTGGAGSLGVVAEDAGVAEPGDGSERRVGDQDAKLVGFAAGVHALVDACGANSAAELQTMKSEGRAAMVARGMDGTTYDAAFAAAYDDGKARLASASSQELATACAQIKETPAMPAAP